MSSIRQPPVRERASGNSRLGQAPSLLQAEGVRTRAPIRVWDRRTPPAQGAGPADEAPLSARQAMVLRALIVAYVGAAEPVSSGRLTELISEPLSSASIRNTLAELHAAGLVDKAHASAGRIPTSSGMSVFIDHLLDLDDLSAADQRLLDQAFRDVEAPQTAKQASHLLSQFTHQLGFVMAPRIEQLRLRTVHLLPVADQRVLAVLVTEHGGVLQRVIDSPERLDTRALERVGALLAERVAGQTLIGLRRRLEAERERLKGEADQTLRRVWWAGLAACQQSTEDDLVIGNRLMLLDQPEFSDPDRIRGLFAALETNQRLLDLLREIGSADQPGGAGPMPVGLAMSLGQELGEPSLKDCALVAVSYGDLPRRDREPSLGRPGSEALPSGDGGLGVLGVIGPQRMDYARVIPMVSYCADLVTRKMNA